MITTGQRLRDEIEMLRQMLDGFSSSLRVASPGIIQSFDAAKQTVTVKVAIREKVNNQGTIEDVEIPILVDVPVVIPQAGGFALTLPIVAGDECFVVFSDNCMDGWFQSGGVQSQIDKRRHDLSDGFAIIGVKSQPNVISGYSTNTAQLRNSAGSSSVEVTSTGVNISGSELDANCPIKPTGYKSSDGSDGITVTITTAKLSVAGHTGSMTFKNGILTEQVQAT